MAEALREVRQALGPEALILETLNIPVQEGKASEARVKITAVRGKQDEAAKPLQQAVPSAAVSPTRHENGTARRTSVATQTSPPPLSTTGEDGLPAAALQQQVADLQTLLYWLAPELKQMNSIAPLVSHDVLPEVATCLVRDAETMSGDTPDTRLRNALIHRIQALSIEGEGDPIRANRSIAAEQIHRPESAGSSDQLRLAFIGPPGVGKTNSLVKLTLRLIHRHQYRVGWLCFDTRRVTGTEELRTYAGILTLPCVSVDTQTPVSHALEQLSECDAVLVDTAGMSPLDHVGLRELATFLQYIPDLRHLLVLSATTQTPTLRRCVEQYGAVGVDAFVFTMLDVCEQFGPLVNTLLTSQYPLAYVAAGADVTQELEPADAEKLGRCIFPLREEEAE